MTIAAQSSIPKIDVTVGGMDSIEEVSPGYASAEYDVEISIGDWTETLLGWVRCGYLAAGQPHLDGSGRDGFSGEWDVVDGDGQCSGRVTAHLADRQIKIGCDTGTDAYITPSDVPEWAALAQAADDATDEDAQDAADKLLLEYAYALLAAISAALEYDVEGPAEPTTDDMYAELDPVEVGEIELPIRIGNYRGCGPAIAWRGEDGDYGSYWHPTGDDVRAVVAKLKGSIQSHISASIVNDFGRLVQWNPETARPTHQHHYIAVGGYHE